MASVKRPPGNGAEAPYGTWNFLLNPGLLTNRIIRSFLLPYPTSEWPLLVKLLVIRGILSLQKAHGASPLPLDTLKETITGEVDAACIKSAMPSLNAQLGKLREEIAEVHDDLIHGQRVGRQVGAQAGQHQPVAAHKPLSGDRKPARKGKAKVRDKIYILGDLVAQRPSSSWRHGDNRHQWRRRAAVLNTKRVPGPVPPVDAPALYAGDGMQASPDAGGIAAAISPAGEQRPLQGGGKGPSREGHAEPHVFPTSDAATVAAQGPALGAELGVYPEWWFNAAPSATPARDVACPPPARQPRLAYTVSKASPEASPWDDDLVTAAYLGVPSRYMDGIGSRDGAGAAEMRREPTGAEQAGKPGTQEAGREHRHRPAQRHADLGGGRNVCKASVRKPRVESIVGRELRALALYQKQLERARLQAAREVLECDKSAGGLGHTLREREDVVRGQPPSSQDDGSSGGIADLLNRLDTSPWLAHFDPGQEAAASLDRWACRICTNECK
eukprot:jgi/Mesvir1/13045/Mv06034-RA.4